MPEGHTIHRLARDLDAGLGSGTRIGASSPQGRFADGASRVHDTAFERAEAWGKHLFAWFGSGDVLHIHLGLIGKLRSVPLQTVAGDTVRLRIEGPGAAWHLTGPQTCAVISPDHRDAVVSGLGPDPLRRGARRRDTFIESFTGTKRPVGAVLLDQDVIAGIGNVYRAELLFLAGIHPERPAASVDPVAAGALWDEAVVQLRRGLAWNRIVTVASHDVDRRVTRHIDREDALYAYHRGGEPCRRCHTPIAELSVAGRSIWYCPSCQPR